MGKKFTNVSAKLHVVLLILVVSSLPFSIPFNGLFIILLSINFLTLIISGGDLGFKKNRAVILLFSSLFTIYLFTFIFAGSRNYFLFLEKKFSIFLIPLVLGGSIKLGRKDYVWVLGAFVISTALATVYSIMGNPPLFFQHSVDIGSYLIMNRPYFGLYVLFSVFILIYFCTIYYDYRLRILLMVTSCYLLYFSYLIYAKMAILGFLITLILLLIYFLIVRKHFRSLVLFLLIMVSGSAVFIFTNETLQMILVKVIKFEPFDLSNNQWVYYLSLNMRYAIWDCCVSLLNNQNDWFWGSGLNNQELLNNCYYSNYDIWIKHGVDLNADIVAHFPFNAHNEFLQTWLDTGVIGFATIVLVVIASFRKAFQDMNLLYLAFLLLFFSCCLTESMLAAQKGIVFYAFFNSFLAFQSGHSTSEKVIQNA